MPRMLKPALIFVALLSVQLSGRSQTSKGVFEYFGEWSDVTVSKSADPQARGNTLQLWKDNGALVGFLNEYVGPVADPPFGPIQDVKLDAKTGKFLFKVKLSLGVTTLKGQSQFVPTRDLYLFTGTLSDQEVRGSVEQQDQLRNGIPSVKRNVVWKREKSDDPFWTGKTLQQWRDFYAPILKARGPKW